MDTITASARRPRASSRGLTMVELLVAMTIFALILVGIVPMMMSAISYNRKARRTMEIRTILNAYTEILKTMPADSFAIGTYNPLTLGSYRIQKVVAADTLNFVRVILTIRSNSDTTYSFTRETRMVAP